MTPDKKFNKSFLPVIIVIESVLLSQLISILLFSLYFSLDFYLHETGHILGGIFNDVITGNQIGNYTISRWIPSAVPYVPMPQQTHVDTGHGSSLFLLGGIYFTITFLWISVFLIHKKTSFTKKNRIFLLPCYVTITQIVNNYYCGTDNLLNRPLEVCQENILVLWYFHWHDFLLLLLFFIIVYPSVREEIPWVIDRIRVLYGYKGDYL